MNPSKLGQASLVCFALAIVCYALAMFGPRLHWPAYAMPLLEVVGFCCGLSALVVAKSRGGRPVTAIVGVVFNGGLLALRSLAVVVLWMNGSFSAAG